MAHLFIPAPPHLHVISADRVFDGEGRILTDGAVLVEGSTIRAVGSRHEVARAYAPDALTVTHHSGCTLLPGLIDAHVHLIMPGTGVSILDHAREPDAILLAIAARNAWLSLQRGVTTLVDLGAKDRITFDLRATQTAGITRGSKLALCGRALTITGGHAWPWGGEADGPDGVRQAVRRLCKEGADVIKVMTTGGGTPGTNGRLPAYTLAELQAIADEAHAHERKVFGHCTAIAGIARAVEAGFDVIAHCQFFRPDGSTAFDAELARRMADQGIFVNPTLQINRILRSERVDWQAMSPERRAALQRWNERYPEFTDAFRRMFDLGVRMVCGSDCGWGYSTFEEIHLELDAMVEAGMSPPDALVSATAHAADALGWDDRVGRLRPGLAADLLLVTGDPTRAISDIANIVEVWLDGAPVLGTQAYGPLQLSWSASATRPSSHLSS